MEQVLELKHIHYSYHTLDGETPALVDISFSVERENLSPLSVPPAAEKPHFCH